MDAVDSELTLEPVSDDLPEAAAFLPERSSAPAVDSVGAVPPQIVERVTIAPPSSWIVEHQLEEGTARPTASNPWLLIDHQFHPERHEYYKRVVRKLDTINAVREAGQWRIDFDPRHDRLTIHSLTVVRGQERTENARLERLRLLHREMGLESLVIQGLLTVVVLLENVRVGDTLDLSYTVQGQSPIFPANGSRWITIPEQLPVRAFCLRTRFATGRPMQWKSNDSQLTPTIREEQGETEWSWRTSTTPATEVEKNVPVRNCLGKWIQISDFTSWTDVAAGFTAAWKEDLQNAEMVQLAESIAAEARTPAQRVERALTFFQDEVRYLSVSGELGGTVPSPPGLVIQRRFGDCKDKAFAAAHLLRRLGIPARPVLVHSTLGESVREFLPTPSAFDHAILEYEIDGRRRWVDVTATLQGGTALSRPGGQFQLGLPIGPGVRDLEPIDTDTSSDRIEVRETFLIDTSGRTSSLRVSVTAAGREAERWRRSMAEVGEEAFARSRERYLQRIFPNAKRAGKLEWEDDRESNEFLLGEVFDLHEFASAGYVPRNVRFRMSAHTIQAVLGCHHVGKRQHPWALPFPCRIKHIIEIDSPSLRKARPQSALVDGSAFRFSSNWQGHQGLTTITFTLQTLKDAVPPSQFEAFKADVREVWRRTGIVGNLPSGSAVSWKKRSSENMLPRRGHPVASKPRGHPPVPDESALLTAMAPPCASPEVIGSRISTIDKDGKGAVIPRRERLLPVHEPQPARQRKEIRRPNPSVPDNSPSNNEIASTQRRARRRARHQRRLIMWAGFTAATALVVALVLYLLQQT